MPFPSKGEILGACDRAEALGYSVEPRVTVGEGRCCPLGAVLIDRGLQEEWAEGISDWMDLAELLRCDPEEVEAFTEAYDGAERSFHPLGADFRGRRKGVAAGPGSS